MGRITGCAAQSVAEYSHTRRQLRPEFHRHNARHKVTGSAVIVGGTLVAHQKVVVQAAEAGLASSLDAATNLLDVIVAPRKAEGDAF
jgi:hypothetical protein